MFGSIFLIICLSVILGLPLVKSLVQLKRFGLLTPPILFSLFVFLGYVVPFPSFVAGTDYFSDFWVTSYGNFERSLNTALLLAISGVVGFYLGYFLRIKLRANRGRKAGSNIAYGAVRFKSTRLITLGAAYTAIGLTFFAIGVQLLGGFSVLLSGLGDRTRLFTGLNYFILPVNLLLSFTILWWQHVLAERRVWDLKFWSYALFAMLLASLQGAKSTIFVALVAGVVLYDMYIKRIRAVTILVGSLVIFVSLTFYALFVREYLGVGTIVSLGPTSKTGSVFSAVQTEFEGNFIQLQCLTVLADAVPGDIPLQHGKTFLSLLTMPIPHQLWPDKPLTAPGVFTIALWPNRWFLANTTVPPGLMGELYMNFDILGPFLGMCVLGWIYRRSYDFTIYGGSPPQVMFYAFLLPLLIHYLRGEFVSPTILLLVLFLPVYLGFRFLVRRGDAQHRIQPQINF